MYGRIINKVLRNNLIGMKGEEVQLLIDFIDEKVEQGFIYINSYEFSEYSGIPKKRALQIILSFTEEDLLFTPKMFLGCPNCKRKTNIYGKVSTCEVCNKDIILEESMKHQITVLFKMNFLNDSSSQFTYIGIVDGVCSDEPVLLGTRIRPKDVVHYGSKDEIMEDFNLSSEQVDECFEYYKVSRLE